MQIAIVDDRAEDREELSVCLPGKLYEKASAGLYADRI